MMNRKNILILTGLALLIGAAVLGRALPHAPNFTPIAAIALFAGFMFRNRLLALTVPVAGMAITDLLFEGVYQWEVMAAVYAAMILPALAGRWMRRPVTANSPLKKGMVKAAKLFTLASGSTILFYLITNGAVWAFSGMFEHTLSGLGICYTVAIPFAKPMLLGNLVYSFGIFGVYYAAEWLLESRKSPAYEQA